MSVGNRDINSSSPTAMTMAKMDPFTHDVIFIDGLWGTGKSVLAPILSGMRGVEKFIPDPAFEYLCILHHLKRLDLDSAVAMIQTYSDIDQYHNLIGRGVNLRWSDDSGAANNPGTLRYLRRLFDGTEGDSVVERINRDNLALNIMSHILLQVAGPLFEAFGDRLKLIEMVRHPAYLVQHWHAYLSRFAGPREFTVSFDCGGHKVPWFAASWSDEYLGLSVTDRVLASLVRLYDWLFSVIDETDRRRLLVVSFENTAFSPGPMLGQLETFLGRAHHPRVGRILRAQKLPRRRIMQGKGHAAYGWHLSLEASEREEYDALLAFVRESGTARYIDPFTALITDYNRRWPSLLNEFE